MMSALVVDLWLLRGKMTVSPGRSVVMSIAWLPAVEPLTRKCVVSAPQACAASVCASRIGPVGAFRSSRLPTWVRSIASTLSPTKSRMRLCMPMPCLWPGVWNGMVPLVT